MFSDFFMIFNLVGGLDPRIPIRTKMSWVRYTGIIDWKIKLTQNLSLKQILD
jgi:hypothetical protein